MLVNSAIELYTMLLAWHLYDGFWSILSGTGIGALPFVVVIISTLLDFQEKENVGSKQLVRVLEVRLYTMLFVFFIAVTPVIDLHTSNTHYIETSCPADDSSIPILDDLYMGDSGTKLDAEMGRYDAMLGTGHVPQAPLWWYVFSRLNLAVANSLKFELPCRADIVTVSANLASANITDPLLRNETAQFNEQCWLPASNKFIAARIPDAEIPPSQKPIVENVAWLGSKYFLNTEGYYDSLRTGIGLTTVPYSVLAGDDVVSDGADNLGWPTCKRWWEDSEYGLRTRLLDDIKNGAMKNKMAQWNQVSPSFFGSPIDAADQLLKTAITAPGKTSPLERLPVVSANLDSRKVGEDALSLAAAAGVAYEGAFAILEAQALKAGAPVAQAFILMMFVILLPLLMFLSLYDIATLVTLTIVQFSVMFWSFLFALAFWLNNFLLSTLYGDHWSEMLTTPDVPLEMLVITWIIKFTYVGLPVLCSLLFGLVGNNLGSGLGAGISRMTSGLDRAGSGAGKAKNLAVKGLKKLSKK
jgi:hypothetical protein